MIKKLWLVVTIFMFLALAQSASFAQISPPASENERTLIFKKEIIELMVQISKMPAPKQAEKIDLILANQSESKTPRSNFLFCTGLAYLDNYKAQACLGSALENGRGIVDDLTEACTWYSIALDHDIADKKTMQKIQDARQRVKMKLQSSYPSPSDEELDELVKAQKEKIVEYRNEMNEAKH